MVEMFRSINEKQTRNKQTELGTYTDHNTRDNTSL